MLLAYWGKTVRITMEGGLTLQGRLRPAWFLFWAVRIIDAEFMEPGGDGHAAAGQIMVSTRQIRIIQVLPKEETTE